MNRRDAPNNVCILYRTFASLQCKNINNFKLSRIAALVAHERKFHQRSVDILDMSPFGPLQVCIISMKPTQNV